jgi:hypothetical protein
LLLSTEVAWEQVTASTAAATSTAATIAALRVQQMLKFFTSQEHAVSGSDKHQACWCLAYHQGFEPLTSNTLDSQHIHYLS